MSLLQLDIDGFIGSWGFSKSYIKNFLAQAGKKPVTIRVSSLGGEVDHALSIHDQLSEYGEVTIHLSGFNASSATLLTLGAKRIIMNSNSFYLIHKALNWVDAWGNMNEDDIDALILSLEKEKKELEKITLVLAKMYSRRTGKPTTEILDLMKQETWLNAEEALAYGFIDEIAEPVQAENLLSNHKMLTLLNCAELPVPVARKVVPLPVIENTVDPLPGIMQKVKTTITNTIKSFFSMKQFTALNAILVVPSLESTDEGIYLSEVQAAAINTALEANQQIVTERDAAIADRNAAATERTNMLASLDAIDPTIQAALTIETKIQAIRDFMAAKPTTVPQGVQTTKDPVRTTDGVDWDLLNSLPHMQEEKY
jgi:ATP-dependent protease ClpP protease subunit